VQEQATQAIKTLDERFRAFRSPTKVPFAVEQAGGPTHVVGSGEPVFTITVSEPGGWDALRSMDQFQIAVAYLEGSLDLGGDLLRGLSMRNFFTDRHPMAYLSRFVRPLVRGQAAADREFIASHYDEESEFFLTFLDTRHRCYTHGLFARDDESLEDAMTRKMDAAIEAIGVKPGQSVLEVGGGWGAFAEYAGKQGINVTTLTISKESERFLNELVADAQVPVSVVREHIYRYAPKRRFDAIVNMGVTEHLPNYRASLQAYRRLLEPGGRVYLDAVAMRHKHRVSTFMSRYIYPGNASPMVLQKYLAAVARSPFEVKWVQEDRHNYYLTCKIWGERLDAAREEIVPRWGEQLYRRFRLFLWGSAAGFNTGQVQAYRWLLELPATP
jgi:cyclopropane-fatty-acyl-phospholipid synthase